MAKDKHTSKPITEAQREKKRQRNIRYRSRYPDKNRLRCAAYRLEHGDECRARDTAYYLTHREARIADVLARDKTRPAVCRAREARWRKAHPEYVSVKDARRKARKCAAPVNDFTVAQWQAMQVAYNHRCVYCGKRCKGTLTIDHITPFALGGKPYYEQYCARLSLMQWSQVGWPSAGACSTFVVGSVSSRGGF